jgi:hypothetical protein
VKNWKESLRLDPQQEEVKKKLQRFDVENKKSGEPVKNAK